MCCQLSKILSMQQFSACLCGQGQNRERATGFCVRVESGKGERPSIDKTDLIDLFHDPVGFGQGDDHFLIMLDIFEVERAALSVF